MELVSQSVVGGAVRFLTVSHHTLCYKKYSKNRFVTVRTFQCVVSSFEKIIVCRLAEADSQHEHIPTSNKQHRLTERDSMLAHYFALFGIWGYVWAI